MKAQIIKSETQYQVALRRFEKLFQSKPGTAEGDQAEVLALLIKDYEDKHFVIASPNPLEAIKYRMEQMHLTKSDLAKIIGHRSRVSDIFKKTRKLNLDMVRKLHNTLHIPLSTLVQEY